MKKYLQNPVIQKVIEVTENLGYQSFIIGGAVRDSILARSTIDIDIVTLGNGIILAEHVAQALSPHISVSVFKNFGTAMFKYQNIEYEFVGARKESYSQDSRKPIVSEGTLIDDQNRRDFTINALAISLQKDTLGALIDPFGGIDDIANGLIRTPLNPDITFSDDPLRMMRAVRFATQLNFTIQPETYTALQRNSERLSILSHERIMEEFNKILLADTPSKGLLMLYDTNLLAMFLPELLALQGVDIKDNISHKDNFYHTLEVVDAIAQHTDNLWLRWAALLHDIAKPLTKKFIQGQGWTFHGHEYVGAKMVSRIFKRLRLPLNEKMKYVQKLVALHLRPIALVDSGITDSAIRRLLFDAGDDIDDLMMLCKADITSKNEQKVRQLHNNFDVVVQKLKDVEEKDALRNWQPPISGEYIMKVFGLKPSKEVGILKEAIREAILEGDIDNTFESAYTFLLAQGKNMGLQPVV